MKPILDIRNISKSYRIGKAQASYSSFRDDLGKMFRSQKSSTDLFYALRDVSFTIEPGETVGIIGRNGAGKSTLLKILSKITPPTSGSITCRGRMASLLEVGTGFHGELTGRENIYLNGAILGMKRREIKDKFDAIVDFSGTEQFLDTALKHYSSGMQLRLAFAVAAFLEPEILVIDEVLAVGDAEFQKKCLGKMEDVSRSGRTILFVSHNMPAVQNLCRTCAWLDKGTLRRHGNDVSNIISEYLTGGKTEAGSNWQNDGSKHTSPYFAPLSFSILGSDGKAAGAVLDARETYTVEIQAEISEPHSALTFGYALYSENGELLFWSYQTDPGEAKRPQLQKGLNILRSELPKALLNEGNYRLELIAGLHYIQWICEPNTDVPTLNIELRGIPSDSPYWLTKRPGLLAPVIQWNKK